MRPEVFGTSEFQGTYSAGSSSLTHLLHLTHPNLPLPCKGQPFCEVSPPQFVVKICLEKLPGSRFWETKDFLSLGFKLCHLKSGVFFCAAEVRLIAASQSSHSSLLQTPQLSAHLEPCQGSTEHLDAARLVQPDWRARATKCVGESAVQTPFNIQIICSFNSSMGPFLLFFLVKSFCISICRQAQKGWISSCS